MGTGHVMRCLALGQAWQEAGGAVDFLTRCESGALVDRLLSEGVNVSRLPAGPDWPALGAAISESHAAALVLDGYHFDPEYQQRARSLCRPLLVIDDIAHQPFYCADILLNQNINAGELHYSTGADTQRLLGCRWALLRKEFRQWHGRQREIAGQARKILVTIGGSDPENVTLRVIEALNLCAMRDELKAVIVVGSGNPHLPALETAVVGSQNIELRSNVSDMPSLMAWADLAITAAGSTCWETAFLGLPSMTLVVADNQEGIARGIEQAGAAVNLGWHRDVTARSIASRLDELMPAQSKRQRMSWNGEALVDGTGAPAVVATILRSDRKHV
jgi:UDP-2,4-diacetamido-2,4,6-trideoxy-beta-L-altropyranose hydrolase